MNAMHSSESNEHYTPRNVVEAARRALSYIDLDPASSLLANTVVDASRIFTASDDGLAQEWGSTSAPSRVFCNPPGGKADGNKSVTKLWWEHGVNEWLSGRVDTMIWIAFKLDFLQVTQGLGVSWPLDFPICYPSERLAYLTSQLPGPTPKRPKRKPTKRQLEEHARTGLCTGESPPHASAIIYLPSRTQGCVERFAAAFTDIGAVRWDPRCLPRRLDGCSSFVQACRA